MKVFIEQPGDENKKNVFNKQTGELEKTISFHITYPYPYGYFVNTKADDGDELDCYVITDTKLETASIVECEPIGMVEYFEGDVEDHKILVRLVGEQREMDAEVEEKLRYFDKHYFDDKPPQNSRIGDFLGIDAALIEIKKAQKF